MKSAGKAIARMEWVIIPLVFVAMYEKLIDVAGITQDATNNHFLFVNLNAFSDLPVSFVKQITADNILAISVNAAKCIGVLLSL